MTTIKERFIPYDWFTGIPYGHICPEKPLESFVRFVYFPSTEQSYLIAAVDSIIHYKLILTDRRIEKFTFQKQRSNPGPIST
jgi:hypothetical protein